MNPSNVSDNPSNRVYSTTLVVILFLTLGACDDDERIADEVNTKVSSADPDAGESLSADASTESISSEQALIYGQEAVDSYDRAVGFQCECFVANSLFSSYDECMSLLSSGPTWAECGAKVLQEFDSPELRVAIDCFFDRSQELAVCYETAECDEAVLTSCPQPILCFVEFVDAISTLVQRCPDLGLLSRVSDWQV